jgi:hypothetical protein
MDRTDRPLARIFLFILLAGPLVFTLRAEAQEKAPAKKRPHVDSRSPFVHRIPLRDEQDNPITVPKGADAEKAKIKLASLATTCGKCHDYPAISVGWHFNFGDPSVNPGRVGEPWILTDEGVLEDAKNGQAYTRTVLPLSYRGWAGTWKPSEVGLNDWKFAYAFGRHFPGGGIFETSTDQRFNVTGHLQNDCLICHVVDGSYDGNARYEQIVKQQNFKYAPLVAAEVGLAEKGRTKLKDTWTPPDPGDPNAEGPAEPPFVYDLSRFNGVSHVLFDISRRVPNERCYFCHTSLDTGRPQTNDLPQRWRHDRDIHLVKGMLCVDCHRHGLDHMVTRGYEKEPEDRKDPSIATLTCQGCHYGTENALGGRSAAPRPVHKGLPTIHFDKLWCTACHSGPYPGAQATTVLTSMAHRLGTESYNRVDDAAPTIQQPVFLRDERTGKITPNKIVYATFWGRLNGKEITPIAPDVLNTSSALRKLFGPKPTNDLQPLKPLSEDEIVKILDAIAGMEAPQASKATTKPATAQAAAAWFTGEPVFVTGGKSFKRGNGKLAAFESENQLAYAWPLAHDVRGAQQALGARGCTDCHASGAPIFDSTVSSAAVFSAATGTASMSDLRGEPTAALALMASTYRFRPILIATGYTCCAILGLILLAYFGRAVGSIGRRRDRSLNP